MVIEGEKMAKQTKYIYMLAALAVFMFGAIGFINILAGNITMMTDDPDFFLGIGYVVALVAGLFALLKIRGAKL